MPVTLIPLRIDLIDEGRFLIQTEEDLQDLQKSLLKYVHDHPDTAAKAKAKLAIDLTIVCENPELETFSIKAEAKKTVPNRPPSVSVAMGRETIDGEPTLFVRRAGSDATTPRQTKLATDDGRTIDPETGEVLPAREKAAAD